ncbi:membrane spanning protein [Streptococcus pneumoniae]|nr:membrane spanning protein [Streptococcus pneumoniae]
MEESKELNAVIDVIMLAGTILLKSGSEIHRVEDTMIRIAHSQGIVDCNVLAMPAAIFFSIENTNISRMKRVTSSSYNIEKVCDVNQISRQLVGGQIDLETAFKQLTALQAQPLPYTKLQVTLAATFSAPFFSVMFSGNIYDALGAGGGDLIWFCLFPLCGKIYPNSLCDSLCWSLCLWDNCPVLGSLHRFSFNGRFDYSWCGHAVCTRYCLDQCGP